ncbi:MAG: hypothetical protein IJG51_02030 [Synergistaceae bacterium]|nr:hypothetical protein [Synergistaceae bacterium]MBQ3397647.1 hypothetical protein [Synergistaceae bacterium]MBQ3758448.1 hypothetical protein [Synergistaceae bacterium]MBQ6114834.1 hypothetical protein [Synergistaceae bacterium]MBQ6664849.1 hypothetical protein [Synergistaceae bacterium]
MARRIITVIIGILLLTGGAGHADDKLNIAVSHPWLALLASFIGGPEVNVIPLRIWNANGDLVMAERGRVLRELDDSAKIVALDENDAKAAGISSTAKFTVKYLYSPFPVSTSSLYDPSVIPFVAQRVLTALSEWDTKNYPYYQRRLAEFQARLSSSILVGQVLKDMSIADFSGSSGILLRAAGCNVERPEEMERWQKGNFSGLREYLEAVRNKGTAIIIDDDTPAVLRRYLSGRADVYKWERPSLETDYPTFLHEQYISLWQKITARPLNQPGRKGKR